MSFWVYILQCSDGSYYVGQTDDLDNRVAEHLQGMGSDYTRRRQPLALVWSEEFTDRLSALAAERQIKGWSRAKKNALIRGDWELVSVLSRKRASTSSAPNGLGDAMRAPCP